MQVHDTVYYTIGSLTGRKIAAFDIDWTIAYSTKKLFPSDPDDIKLLPHRLDKLLELQHQGHNIMLFTNQKSRGAKDRTNKVARIQTLVDHLRDQGVAASVFIAVEDDKYRKPGTGMWDLMLGMLPAPPTEAFFVGDAIGRSQDFSDSDLEFAKAINVPCHSPEKFFEAPTRPVLPAGKKLIVMMGMPGSGKSTMAKKLGVHINRDALGGKVAHVIGAAKQAITEGKSVVIDATNPSFKDRMQYYELAPADYTICVVYMLRDGRGFNNLRDPKLRVPTIAYHKYFKALEEPYDDGAIVCTMV